MPALLCLPACLKFGCTGPRWATRYRDLKAPRATALSERLLSKGAGCDCEIFMNGWACSTTFQLWDPETEAICTNPSCPPAQAFELAPSSPVVSGPPTTGGRPIEAEECHAP